MGIGADEADAQRLIQLIDLDNDKQIDYMEFKRFIIMLPSSQASLQMRPIVVVSKAFCCCLTLLIS
jgi:Ca2+-binding EF-hand superfamily protein